MKIHYWLPHLCVCSTATNEIRKCKWNPCLRMEIRWLQDHHFQFYGNEKRIIRCAKKNRRQNIKKWLYDGRKKTREWLKIKFDVEIRHLRILEQWNKNMYTCNEQRIVFGALLNCKLELNLSSTSAFLMRSFATMNCNHFHLSIKFPF